MRADINFISRVAAEEKREFVERLSSRLFTGEIEGWPTPKPYKPYEPTAHQRPKPFKHKYQRKKNTNYWKIN